MGEKKMVAFQGRQVQAQSLSFESSAEPWTQYALEDGTQLKTKSVLLEVLRLDEYNENGDPVYQFSIQQIVGTVVPEGLKRKKQ